MKKYMALLVLLPQVGMAAEWTPEHDLTLLDVESAFAAQALVKYAKLSRVGAMMGVCGKREPATVLASVHQRYTEDLVAAVDADLRARTEFQDLPSGTIEMKSRIVANSVLMGLAFYETAYKDAIDLMLGLEGLEIDAAFVRDLLCQVSDSASVDLLTE